MKTIKRISFFPFFENWDPKDPNSYVMRMMKAIRMAFPEAQIITEKDDNKREFYSKSDVYWLNWYENIPNNQCFYKHLAYALMRFGRLLQMKMSRGKVCMVMHNKLPHDAAFPRADKLFMKLALLLSDRVITLCKDGFKVANDIAGRDISKKIRIVHHPTYECKSKSLSVIGGGKLKVLYTGRLKRYKNIEMLLEVAKELPNIDFVIVGFCYPDYRESLEKLVAGLDNVTYQFDYISDECLNAYMDSASVMILPYKQQSSLNSGMAMYAFSKGLSVIMPEIGTINELQSKDDVYHYSYATEQEHKEKIKTLIKKVDKEYREEPDTYRERVERIQKEVLSHFNLDEISKEIREAVL